MKCPAMTVVLVMLVVSLTTLFITGDACDNVQTRSRSDVCFFQFKGMPTKYKLCMKMLENTPDTAEVTVYTLMATRLAKQKYETSAATLQRLMANASLPADERAKYKYCVNQYHVAREHIDCVINDLEGCKFKHIKQEYNDSDTALWNCQNALPESSLLSGWPPLVKMVMGDRDATNVADSLFSFV
ncbi:hypothetical protein QOZ80_8BG0644530 [Eleusine coracana subsp. coracana]|nr:hypothetical protein QOZ80_8BG0644530 [Eleusine coracana subsp. coracana]